MRTFTVVRFFRLLLMIFIMILFPSISLGDYTYSEKFICDPEFTDNHRVMIYITLESNKFYEAQDSVPAQLEIVNKSDGAVTDIYIVGQDLQRYAYIDSIDHFGNSHSSTINLSITEDMITSGEVVLSYEFWYEAVVEWRPFGINNRTEPRFAHGSLAIPIERESEVNHFLKTYTSEILIGVIIACCAVFIVTISIRHIHQKEQEKLQQQKEEKEKEAFRQAAIQRSIEMEQQRIQKAKQEARERLRLEREAAEKAQYEANQRQYILSQQRIEEQESDGRLARSELVHDVAMCLIPFFKKTIDEADRDSHLIVSIEFGICVTLNGISYFEVNGKQSNHGEFIWKKENITEQFSPIMRKSICKALISEIQVILFELYPQDANGQNVNIHLAGEVTLSPAISIPPNPIPGVTYYDDVSAASGKIVYSTFIEKKPRTF